jgi:hypothetical protein
MAEVLMSYDTPVSDPSGTYHARAVGRLADDGMWQGWLEFVPIDGGTEVLVGSVETTQPERHDLVYWSTGLTTVFLEGALHRARTPLTVRTRTVEVPVSDAPAVKAVTTTRVMPPGPEPVLDPFDIGGRNLDVLRQELGALNRPRLLNIITAYDLNPGGEDISWMSDRQLIHFIVTAVESQMIQRAR